MAEAISNIRLEYAKNTIEFWRIDDAGAPVSFASPTAFNIERMDNPSASVPYTATLSDVTENGIVTPNAKATISVNPTNPGILYVSGDELYNHNMDEFIHIYSLKSLDSVYLAGKVHMYEVAG